MRLSGTGTVVAKENDGPEDTLADLQPRIGLGLAVGKILAAVVAATFVPLRKLQFLFI